MVLNMRDIGRMISKMVKELKVGQMEANMMEAIRKA